MIYPKTEIKFINEAIGFGVVATEFIPAGTITWVLDKLDRQFSPEEFDNMDTLYQNILDIYTFRHSNGNFVLCWDNARFVNHSFKSNCLTTAYDFEIAIRDIQVGEQLTDDYGYLNITQPFLATEEDTERKIVYPDDLLRYYQVWDEQLRSVFHRIPSLPQALKDILPNKIWEEIEAVVAGKKEMESILKNYYPQKK